MSSIFNFRSLTSVQRDVTSGTRTSVKTFLKTSFFRISEIAWCCADSSLEIESKSSVIYLSHQYVLSCHFWLCCLLQKTVLTFWWVSIHYGGYTQRKITKEVSKCLILDLTNQYDEFVRMKVQIINLHYRLNLFVPSLLHEKHSIYKILAEPCKFV